MNKKGYWFNTGTSYKKIDGKFKNYAPVFVPMCCLECKYFVLGDFGEYGERLSAPYCHRNIWFPTKKGACKKWKKH